MTGEVLINENTEMNREAKGNYNSKEEFNKNNDMQAKENVALNLVKEKLETFHVTVMQDVQRKMDSMVEDIIQEIRLYEMKTGQFKNFAREQYNQIWNNRKMHSSGQVHSDDATTNNKSSIDKSKIRKLPEKIFMPRESYLTALLEVNHMKSIYNFFYVILIFMFLHNGIYGYVMEEKINLGLDTIKKGFGYFDIALLIWICLQIPVLTLFYAFKMWSNVRHCLQSNNFLQSMWSYSCLTTFISFLLLFGYVACICCIKYNFPLITSCCVLMEATRLIMKMHAFVRTNAGWQLTGKLKTTEENDDNNLIGQQSKLPLFNNYLYFLFAPTLIYRNSYPRTKQIRWKFAISRFLEVLAIIFLISYCHERYLRPSFINFGTIHQTSGNIVVSVFGVMMPGLIIFLCGFYCILHAWLNFTSELLKFADRMFYRDWWTAGNYDTYYRYWNTVVHDYLYEYIYKDVYNYVFKGSKLAAQISVFLISAIIHEIILSVGLRFVYPVMFVFFIGIGGMLIWLTRYTSHTTGNMVILAGGGMGNGMMMAFYYMEYYARENCIKDDINNSWLDLFKWVSWHCNGMDL